MKGDRTLLPFVPPKDSENRPPADPRSDVKPQTHSNLPLAHILAGRDAANKQAALTCQVFDLREQDKQSDEATDQSSPSGATHPLRRCEGRRAAAPVSTRRDRSSPGPPLSTG